MFVLIPWCIVYTQSTLSVFKALISLKFHTDRSDIKLSQLLTEKYPTSSRVPMGGWNGSPEVCRFGAQTMSFKRIRGQKPLINSNSLSVLYGVRYLLHAVLRLQSRTMKASSNVYFVLFIFNLWTNNFCYKHDLFTPFINVLRSFLRVPF